MSKKFLTSIQLPGLASPPASPSEGEIYYDTDDDAVYVYTGSGWQQLAFPTIGGGSVPAGAMTDYAGATAPSGWLLCHGQAVSRTTYADLFTAIGTAWGVGDGSTTFNVPDMRGRVGVGLDNMGGSDAGRLSASNTLGGSGGAESHQLSLAELPTNNMTARWRSDTVQTGSTGNMVNLGGVTGYNVGSSGALNVGGSDAAHNNMQPYALVNVIIRT